MMQTYVGMGILTLQQIISLIMNVQTYVGMGIVTL